MSNRHADPLDDNLDRWVDDPTAENASRLADGGGDGERWQRWHMLLRDGGNGPEGADESSGTPPFLDLPALSPRALRLAARAVVDAWRDPGRRSSLRADPRAVLAGFGVDVPAGVEVRAVTMPLGIAARSRANRAILELPLPAATAPPADEPSVRNQLRGTPHEWVIWAAFGPFEALEARPAIAALADVPRGSWRAWLRPVPARAWAFAGVLAAAAVVLVAAPGVLGPLAGAAVGPSQGVRLVLALSCAVGAVLLLVSMRRR